MFYSIHHTLNQKKDQLAIHFLNKASNGALLYKGKEPTQ